MERTQDQVNRQLFTYKSGVGSKIYVREMRNLIEYISEKNWSEKVDTDWSPEEGLFTRKDPNYIAKYLLDHSKDERQAMSRLVFYMNRAGDNLKNKTVLNKVKDILKK